jgi:hypothetical protein
VGTCRDFKGDRGGSFTRRGDIGEAISAGMRAFRSSGRLKEGGGLADGAHRVVAQTCGWGWQTGPMDKGRAGRARACGCPDRVGPSDRESWEGKRARG